jgi:hypothetical protein
MMQQFTIKTMLFAMLVAAIWCKAGPIACELGSAAASIVKDWRRNSVIHDRLEVINTNAGRSTWPDRFLVRND